MLNWPLFGLYRYSVWSLINDHPVWKSTHHNDLVWPKVAATVHVLWAKAARAIAPAVPLDSVSWVIQGTQGHVVTYKTQRQKSFMYNFNRHIHLLVFCCPNKHRPWGAQPIQDIPHKNWMKGVVGSKGAVPNNIWYSPVAHSNASPA